MGKPGLDLLLVRLHLARALLKLQLQLLALLLLVVVQRLQLRVLLPGARGRQNTQTRSALN